MGSASMPDPLPDFLQPKVLPEVPAIRCANLVKRFDGFAAVDDLSLEVPQGAFYAFLGPNGAGKSTTIDMLLGLTRPDAGAVTQIDTTTMTVHDQVGVGSDPTAVAVSGGSIWVANGGNATVQRIDGVTHQPGPPIHVPGGPSSIGAADNGLTPPASRAPAFGAGDSRMQAMYAPVTAFPSSLTVTLDSSYYPNEQPQNRYFYFTAPGMNATVSSASAFDVDLYAFHDGELLNVAESSSGYETIPFATIPGETYVVVLTGWGRPNAVPAPGTYAATVTFSVP